ncbi:MAG: hypothetical protein M3083_06315 [Actinomycetota bacterium]|nr:hypothetical protein [Actinomycetota bacterium]
MLVAAIVYRFLGYTTIGWRGQYLLGMVPMIGAAVWRRRLHESARWIEGRRNSTSRPGIPFRQVISGPYRYRLAAVSGVMARANFAVLGASASVEPTRQGSAWIYRKKRSAPMANTAS